jgi:hypothetical protein
MMKNVFTALAGGLLIGTLSASYAVLPPPSPEEKAAAAAKAEKAASDTAKAAKDVAKAQDRAVANYKKNKGSSSTGSTAQPGSQQNPPTPQPPVQSQGADHSNAALPDSELTPHEAQTEMPKPGQVNDYSTTARDPQNSSGRR